MGPKVKYHRFREGVIVLRLLTGFRLRRSNVLGRFLEGVLVSVLGGTDNQTV